MRAPSIRGATVTVGFLGVTLVVAGAATAMTSELPAEPVATAVTLAHDDPDAAAAAEAPPATPVEVRSRAIECSDAGECEGRDATAAVPEVAPVEEPAPAPAAPDTPPTPAAPAPPAPQPSADARSPRDCAWPDPPQMPADGDRDAWETALEQWLSDTRAVAQDCGADAPRWRDVWEGWGGRWEHERADGWTAWADKPRWSVEREPREWVTDEAHDRDTHGESDGRDAGL